MGNLPLLTAGEENFFVFRGRENERKWGENGRKREHLKFILKISEFSSKKA